MSPPPAQQAAVQTGRRHFWWTGPCAAVRCGEEAPTCPTSPGVSARCSTRLRERTSRFSLADLARVQLDTRPGPRSPRSLAQTVGECEHVRATTRVPTHLGRSLRGAERRPTLLGLAPPPTRSHPQAPGPGRLRAIRNRRATARSEANAPHATAHGAPFVWRRRVADDLRAP